jgi:hypothetical protein
MTLFLFNSGKKIQCETTDVNSVLVLLHHVIVGHATFNFRIEVISPPLFMPLDLSKLSNI